MFGKEKKIPVCLPEVQACVVSHFLYTKKLSPFCVLPAYLNPKREIQQKTEQFARTKNSRESKNTQ